MVARLRISPADGIKMSPPGIDVNANARKLLDPRFANLQLHARGSGTMPLRDAGDSFNPYEWEVLDTFPDLGAIPIAFVNTKYPGQDHVDFPASMVPVVPVYIPGYGDTISYVNWFRVTNNSIQIRAHSGDGTAPTYRYEIYKNARDF